MMVLHTIVGAIISLEGIQQYKDSFSVGGKYVIHPIKVGIS